MFPRVDNPIPNIEKDRRVRFLTVLTALTLSAMTFPAAGTPDSASSGQSPGHAPSQNPRPTPPLLLVDDTHKPTVTIRWKNKSDRWVLYSAPRPYAADAAKTTLGGNIDCFVAVGGTRLTKGAGHPKGAVVRVGFYKHDKGKPFFDGITKDTTFEIMLRGVRFNQPVEVHPDSILMHLKYDRGDMNACGIPGDAREQFNLASPDETLNDRIRPGIDARLGALDGSKDALGSADLRVEDDGSVTMAVRFKYPALRNIRDPWQSDLPGTFLEPIHFHVEFEALPLGVAPLDPRRERITVPAAAHAD